MQLTVSEAARVLKVSEDMIYQWIRNDQLPATRFGSRYRINRVKLIEWAHKQGVAMEIQGSIDQPVLENAILRGNLSHGIEAENLGQLFEKIISTLSVPSGLKTDNLQKYIGIRRDCGLVLGPHQVAVPDARSPNVLPLSESIVEIAYLGTPIAIGDGTCSTVFFIFVRSISEHLNLFSRILFVLSDTAFLSLLQQRSDKETLLSRLRELSVVNASTKSMSSSWNEVD